MSDTQQQSAGGASKSKSFFYLSSIVGVVLSAALIAVGGPSGTAPQAESELAQALRIQKVGSVEIRAVETDRPLASGEEVYKAQCAACHATGVSGAPIFANAGAWGERLPSGLQALAASSINGKGAMSPQGGGKFTDYEITLAVVYMANAAGGSFQEPEPPAAKED